MLPRPYGWEVFDRQNDPNNPYNMVDSAPHPEAANAGMRHEPVPAPAEEPPRQEERQEVTLPPVALAPPSLEVGLSGPELEALGRIIDLMQEMVGWHLQCTEIHIITPKHRAMKVNIHGQTKH